MYQAIKFFNRKPLQNVMVHSKTGENVAEPNAVYNIIADHFKVHYCESQESKLGTFVGNIRPLDTKNEVVKKHSQTLKQQSSWIWSNTPELLKYDPTELYDLIAESLNNIFAKHKYISVGYRLLTAS